MPILVRTSDRGWVTIIVHVPTPDTVEAGRPAAEARRTKPGEASGESDSTSHSGLPRTGHPEDEP
jgi:hypothetical protein